MNRVKRRVREWTFKGSQIGIGLGLGRNPDRDIPTNNNNNMHKNGTLLGSPRDLNLNIRTGNGRLPPKKAPSWCNDFSYLILTRLAQLSQGSETLRGFPIISRSHLIPLVVCS